MYVTGLEPPFPQVELQCHGDASDGGCGVKPNNLTMNYMIVMTLAGEIKAVFPHNGTTTVDALHPSPSNSKQMLMALNLDYGKDGPAAVWSWGDDELVGRFDHFPVGNGYSRSA